ncbi:hypothetical protein [Argonema galeatum]|uniref:hypothetical protein n=1 Tax=Argonema galeatum TaxID=2942762 RepID=UPI002012A96F|nr:hypothetical protein [Argonema galeatum]MCL1465947.1 hypothetical protein [Argonema galeatum A003/A1]
MKIQLLASTPSTYLPIGYVSDLTTPESQFRQILSKRSPSASTSWIDRNIS